MLVIDPAQEVSRDPTKTIHTPDNEGTGADPRHGDITKEQDIGNGPIEEDPASSDLDIRDMTPFGADPLSVPHQTITPASSKQGESRT